MQRPRASVAHSYERIAASARRLGVNEAEAIARRRFGIEVVECRRLPGETDCNFHLTDAGGERYVLKVADQTERVAAHFQVELLRHIAEVDAALPVPRPFEAVDGSFAAVLTEWDQPLVARMLSWLPGMPLADIPRRSEALLTEVGTIAGRLTAATASFQREPPQAPGYWELASGHAIADGHACIEDAVLRSAVERVGERFRELAPALGDLPTAVVHQDLNGFNVLVTREGLRHAVTGVIDFGDATRTIRVADLAILMAAVMRGSERPLLAAAAIARSYCAALPLTEAELDAVFDLAVVRLAAVVATTARLSAERRQGDPRHRAPESSDLLLRLAVLPASLGRAAVRAACGLDGLRQAQAVRRWLRSHRDTSEPIVAGRLRAVDLSASSDVFDGIDPKAPGALVGAAHARLTTVWPAIARHGEPAFLNADPRRTGRAEPANVRIGTDLFAPAGTTVASPLDGVVELVDEAASSIVMRHELTEGVRLWLAYSGVDPGVVATVPVRAGDRIGSVSETGVDDRLPSHVRVRLACAPVADWQTMPYVCTESERSIWLELLLDPTPLLSAPPGTDEWEPLIERALTQRDVHLARSHPIYYRRPVHMVRGRGSWFYDEQGRAYLDALNNVTLLGHCEPRLVAAASRQLGRLNTNARFVYDVLGEYAEKLTATLPEGLEVVYFVNSGSEAVDLALRMSRHLTGRDDVLIIDDAYHGYTSAVSDVSPSRYRHAGKPETTHPVVVPDRYRGEFGYELSNAGARYAARATARVDQLAEAGTPPAAFLCEALLAAAGQIVLPPGYLAPVFDSVRALGGFTIADEVQVGFGRLGEAFWGFEIQGVVPDFVALGKAMGNGFPVAALVTTRDISQAFDPAGRFFATYGGNPVACAVGLELLEVVEADGLQQNALIVGRYFRDRLRALGDRHAIIGDVRGQGLYSGVELVHDRETKLPAGADTLQICEALKHEGVLAYPTGPRENVLKLKPPLVFTHDDVNVFTEVLDQVLTIGW